MGIVRGVRRQIAVLSSFVLVLFLLAACSGTGSTNGPQPGTTPTATQQSGTANGCPNNTVVTTLPSKANVVVNQPDLNTTVTAHNGDTIEIRLPFGHKWTGPDSTQGKLELQPPAGFAWNTDSVCVWRFVAKGTGSTELTFHSQALCKPGEVCPMFITTLPVTVDVK